jgi:hypothetical protein
MGHKSKVSKEIMRESEILHGGPGYVVSKTRGNKLRVPEYKLYR